MSPAPLGVVRSFQAGEQDLMKQRPADTGLLQSPEKQPTPRQPLIPQHLWISGKQTRKEDLGACG